MVLLLEIISIGIILLDFSLAAVILLSVSVAYGIYYLFTKKSKVKDESHKYIFTYNAIMNDNLSNIIEHNIIQGEFFLSNKIISEKKTAGGDMSLNDILFENLAILKSRGKLQYVNSGSGISEILSYAYKNNCTVVSSNENISKKILQMFSVKVIDIGFLKKRRTPVYKKGDRIKVLVMTKSEDGYWGTINHDERVFLGDFNLAENSLINAEVEKILEISGEKTIYAKKKD